MATAISSGQQLAISIDGGASFARLQRAFAFMPKAAERAMARALRKLKTWLQRQVLRAAARSTGIGQKYLAIRAKGGARWYATLTKFGLEVWFGTNPMPAHRTGKVTWSRRMRGARVARRSYPGAWSWGAGSGTGAAVMYRTGSGRLPIARKEEEIHPPVVDPLQGIADDAAERFERLLAQELNYALNVEAAK